MLQAESSCARDWSSYNLPETTINRKIVRKTTYKVNHKRKFFIKSGALVFGFALLLVFLCIKSATLGYQIEKLEQDIQNLETANHRIDYAIAEKTSLDRIEQVATTELGMVRPDEKSSIAMEVKTEPVKVASTSVSATEDKTMSQKFLDKMFASLSRLAQK